jgi:hypothetical protein
MAKSAVLLGNLADRAQPAIKAANSYIVRPVYDSMSERPLLKLVGLTELACGFGKRSRGARPEGGWRPREIRLIHVPAATDLRQRRA